MFERFTERARQVIVLAQEEARSLRHNYIGTEHLLSGLLREKEGLAARALSKYLNEFQVRSDIDRIIGKGEEYQSGQLPFTPRSKKVMENALREALALGHKYIGTEHILLSLIREEDGVAKRILLDNDVVVDDVRDDVIAILHGPRSEKKSSAQHKTEEETSKESSQESSESSQEKAAVTITYGGWTLKIEGDTSGHSNIPISKLLGFASKIFEK